MLFAGEPRAWKWLVPGLTIPVLGYVVYWVNQGTEPWVLPVSCLLILWMAVLGVQTVNMCWAYFRKLAVDDFARRQHALSVTADSVRLEAAKGVHPRVFELLLGERARRWELVSGTQSETGTPYKVLHAAPIVTEAFFVHFLKKSTKTSYLSMRMLSDGDKSWDPNGIVTAYEMYEAVEKMLADELKIVRPYGKHGKGMWLPDWEPESVALDFDIDLDEWNYQEEEKEQADDGLIKLNDMGVMRDLPKLRKE